MAVLCTAAALVLVDVATSLPTLEDRALSVALRDTSDSRLGEAIAEQVAAHPGRSGVYPLTSGQDAFTVRLRLAQTAERSIDAQYYIWRDDLTGKLLYRALFDAAERGVRVRLLLDDNRTSGLDPLLAALDAHPNIEVRLFNPFVLRRARLLGYLTDFMRLNRRMHSKSFTVDNQVTIIGGRNVGDEYFDAAPEGALAFSDLDVLAAGPVVAEVSTQFDQYWASRSAHPAAPLLPAPRHGVRELLAPSPAAAARLDAAQNAGPVDELLAGSLAFEWAPVQMLSDDPAKGLGLAPPETHFPRLLTDALGPVAAELDLVSPYFVPTTTAVATLTSMAAGGVKVRILVNSLEATDVKAVHSGYVKWRAELLAAGIELFEMRLVGSAAADERLAGPFGSSATSLHAKTIAADRCRIFIGSFNLDQRSASLNTELGFVIESSSLAGRLAQLFDEAIPEVAYRVELSGDGDLYWVEQRGGERIRHDTEPGTTAWERAAVTILSWLPIDWLL